MASGKSSLHELDRPPRRLSRLERLMPFWGPQLVILVAIVIGFTLPDRLVPFGPRWLVPALEALLLVALVLASPSHRRHSSARRQAALGVTAVVSATNIVSLGLLVHYLLRPVHGQTGPSGHQLILAGDTGHAFVWTDRIETDIDHTSQHMIAYVPAEPIVDTPKVVEVEREQRKRCASALGPLDFPFDPIDESLAVA